MTDSNHTNSDELLILVERGTRNDTTVVVRLEGILDTTTAPILEDTFQELEASSSRHVVVDLSKVTYISSAGWGVFVGELRRFRNNHGDIILVGMTREVREVFNLLELHVIIHCFDDVESAVSAFRCDPSIREILES